MAWGSLRVAVLFALLAAAPPAQGCGQPRVSAAYAARVERVLRAGTDLWGDELLRAPGGPTLAAARRYLPPLRYARTSRGRPLTASGVYYLPFAQPDGPQGAGSVALHVADGSQIYAETTEGQSLTVFAGGARFSSCGARLAGGWLPVLETRDRGYAQESFAARIPETRSLVSFVRVRGRGSFVFTPSVRGLHDEGNTLVRNGRTYLVFSAGGRFDGRSVEYRGGIAYIVWLARPGAIRPLDPAAAYAPARASVATYWRQRLAAGAVFDVPEPYVEHAERALLVQNLELTWRYSIGNPYEEFSFPESLDAAQATAEYGFADVARAMLRTSLTRRPAPYPSWRMGEKLLAASVYARLFADDRFVAQVTPALGGYVAALARSLALGGRGLLARERYSSDIPDQVYGFHAQAVVWQGLRAIADVWAGSGRAALAERARRLARSLETGLRQAVRASERRVPDGSLFVPMRLLDGERPYRSLVESRDGSYWNLVAPYALASGFLTPAQADGVLRYMLRHGSRLLGLVRAGGFALYGRRRSFPTSGTDQVYGVNAARFLAAEDQADQLVLSLYGQLAAGMTPNTYVSGEAASVAPVDRQRYRAMYLPPNSVSNDTFLETLRLTLVQETANGLRLAYATPRAWLEPGKRIAVTNAPTAFGRLSYSLEAGRGAVHVTIVVPSRRPPRTLRLRLRLPNGTRTIDLSRKTGTLDFFVRTP